ncbi:mucin-15 [Cuculus canorus]|uniref:mucin-15 n=1 Tax=Cuculus canorus TaxID=55661 RepID=UPI0023AAF8CE|nr:mucin-15 [Cuculus canorus]
MQPSCGMIFVFLLVKLEWNKSNSEGRNINETKNGNSSIRDNDQSAVQPTSHRTVLPTTIVINSSAISHTAATTVNAKENIMKSTEMSSWPKSTPLRATDGITLSSNVTMVSKSGISNSPTNLNRIPMSSATFTTVGNLSGVTKSAVATSTFTVTPSNSTATHSTASAAVLLRDNSSTNPTMLFPTGITLTSPMTKQDSSTLNFSTIQQTTEQNHNFINPFTTTSNAKDVSEDKTNKGGVTVGVIVGAILVSILIGLVGYFISCKKRSESFSHRRLYDDTRSDPVLHLDNSLGPHDTSFGCLSDDKTSPGDKAEDNAECPCDGIPMADMTPSHPSP